MSVHNIATPSNRCMQEHYDGQSIRTQVQGVGLEGKEWKPITHPFLAPVSPAKQHNKMETDGREGNICQIPLCQGGETFGSKLRCLPRTCGLMHSLVCGERCRNSLWQHKLTFSEHSGGRRLAQHIGLTMLFKLNGFMSSVFFQLEHFHVSFMYL